MRVRLDAGGDLWLRGDALTDAIDLELRKLPGAQRYRIDTFESDDVLLPLGKLLPDRFLPEDGWTPIEAFFQPVAGRAALPGVLVDRLPLTLVRSVRPAEANILLTTVSAWTGWAIEAPQVRLRRLSFAASSDGDVVVRGSPLPPIPGQWFVEDQGIAVPAGLAIRPAVDAATLRTLWSSTPADLILARDDRPWTRIAAEHFVAASRSAARATAAAWEQPIG